MILIMEKHRLITPIMLDNKRFVEAAIYPYTGTKKNIVMFSYNENVTHRECLFSGSLAECRRKMEELTYEDTRMADGRP